MDRQRSAVRFASDCGAVAPGGVVDEIGDCAGAHRGRASGTERAARADASHDEAGDGLAPGGEPACAAASVPPFSPRVHEQRPHEALGMQTPSAVYRPSPRPYPARVPEPEYGSALQVRRVDRSGVFSWKGDVVFLSETLIGEPIGLLPQDDRFYTVYFITSPIARFDSHRRRILALPAALAPAGAGAGASFPCPCSPSTRCNISKGVRDVPGLKCQACPRLHNPAALSAPMNSISWLDFGRSNCK